MTAFDNITAGAGKIVELVGVDPHNPSSVMVLFIITSILMAITYQWVLPALVKRAEASADANKDKDDAR